MTAGRPLLLVGTGGLARETAEVVRAINDAGGDWNLQGFLDDDSSRWGTDVDGLPVLGGPDQASRRPDTSLVVCTGNPTDYGSRRRIVQRLNLPPSRYPALVHPSAVVARNATLGPGAVLLAGAVVTSAAGIGAHVVVMPGTVITHDDLIEDFATLASGVRLGGGVQLGTGAYLGAGAMVRENCRVGTWSMVGMGALVLADVPDHEVWVGSPARRLRAATVRTTEAAGSVPGAA